MALAKKEEYLEQLRKRAKESNIYRPHQLHGLEIADILGDRRHKSLYIKLAKEYRPEALRRLAKSVAEQKDVKNRGAYFMAIFSRDKEEYERHERKNSPAR